jgi:hypothetical protein
MILRAGQCPALPLIRTHFCKENGEKRDLFAEIRLRAATPETQNPWLTRGFASGASRTRTGDLLGAIQALSQLSYSPGRRRLPRGCGTV